MSEESHIKILNELTMLYSDSYYNMLEDTSIDQ